MSRSSLALLDGYTLLNITLYVYFRNVYEKDRAYLKKVNIVFVVFVAPVDCLIIEASF